MPYSKQNELLFIHIPKNAGKSMEVALGLTTPSESQHYAWRNPLNRLAKALQKATRDSKAKPRLWGIDDATIALQHLTYTEIELLEYLSKSELKKSTKVAVVRNPWDRVISSYRHMGKAYEDLASFIQHWYDEPSKSHNELAHKRSQMDFIVDKRGKVVIDHLLRFENLGQDFSQLVEALGLNAQKLGHIGNQNPQKTPYHEHYNPQTKQMVAERFAEEIEYFQYHY